ncbi:hypothetical protein Taro_054334, partial [Colocasia esculenta]|nr:hypothetical protein [Colocasia esculenta]
SLPPGAENLHDIPSGGASAAAMSHALGSLRDPILRWARSQPSPPAALLSDFFLGWTQGLAADLGIPRLVFYSSRALLASLFDQLWVRRVVDRDDIIRSSVSSVVSMPEIPGSPSFPYGHLPSLYLRYREGVPEWEFMKEGMVANPLSWGAVLNTFRGLEGAHLDHLMRERGHRRVWAVGPLLPAAPSSTQRGGQSSVPPADVMAWLDARPGEGSVVYICFGSQFVPSPEQGAAIAAALERSGVSFVWCMKDTSSLEAAGGEGERGQMVVVPEGFRERTAGRGVVIEGWAPQVAILRHAAVGAFVTHCGWNSVLEGIAAGVVLLAWPMEADQFVNARLLVEETGVAVRVCEGPGSSPDPDEFVRILKSSASRPGKDPGLDRVRARAAELGRQARDAVGEGGTSSSDLEGLIRELSCLSVCGPTSEEQVGDHAVGRLETPNGGMEGGGASQIPTP